MHQLESKSKADDAKPSQALILITGATGYVGGRLLDVLEQGGRRVRCAARHPENLRARVLDATEVVEADVLDLDSLRAAMEGVETAFYLIHSMGSSSDFEEKDRQGAENFGAAARDAGVRRIIYLGGLGDSSDDLSSHLRSRHEVGDVLRESQVQVIEFRASVIIGSGSLSFEMIRALVERLPLMITPKWVSALAQPIAIGDVLTYLQSALDLQIEGNQIFEIGGPDKVSYRDLMKEYGDQRGLHRLMIGVPILTPRLSSLWLGLVTPLYARVGRKLIESIQFSTIIKDDSALRIFPIRPLGYRQAIGAAMRNEDRDFARTSWSDALSSGGEAKSWGGVRFGNRLVDSRTAEVSVGQEAAFRPIRRIGGAEGWYYGTFLWKLRGFIDLLVGGVGVRRGRRHPDKIVVGDAIDFWRVEAYEPNRRLLLAAEMKLPGRAWLEFEVTSEGQGSMIRQTAMFDPVGIGGLLYWYGIYPLHQAVFAGMLRKVARAAESHTDV